jgi:hypothetical protein
LLDHDYAYLLPEELPVTADVGPRQVGSSNRRSIVLVVSFSLYCQDKVCLDCEGKQSNHHCALAIVGIAKDKHSKLILATSGAPTTAQFGPSEPPPLPTSNPRR